MISPQPIDPNTWLKYFDGQAEQLIAAIIELASLDSPSHDKKALATTADWLHGRLERLPADVERHSPTAYGDHLVARLPGRDPTLAPVLLVGHYDTVWDVGEAEKRPPCAHEGMIHGPGVYDMKSGLVLILAALDAVYERGLLPPRPITVIMNGDEELGSPDSRDLIQAEAVRSRAALVAEPSTLPDMIRLRRKGTGIFNMVVEGRASHAGADPGAGASAVVELAHQVVQLAEIQEKVDGVTINVGTIAGGMRRNVVASHAQALVDLRFIATETGLEATSKIAELIPLTSGTSVSISGGINRPAMTPSEKGYELYALATNAANKLGYALTEELGGGASDGNLTSAVGCPTLCGLGGVGGGAHALTEHVVVKWLPRKAALLSSLMHALS